MGVDQAAGLSGMFIGLVLGGVLAPINWRLIFLVSAPVGLFGTVWGYLKLRELGKKQAARIDWPGKVTFALGLILIMVGITYGIEPYGKDTMGWTNPSVLTELALGIVLLVTFGVIETKVAQPNAALDFAILVSLLAAAASWTRGAPSAGPGLRQLVAPSPMPLSSPVKESPEGGDLPNRESVEIGAQKSTGGIK